ncbi:coenzyme A pyrophosphatase [Flavonifractor sp. An82]|uniref:NUDIX hydrolase n=1 Tax=Flavonifractor sp. An82 TaxID=1965660 RepID=UPI000B3733E5|nr:CoA pyrophosphatase [Flavonifractor sp. An82]OUN21890.1 coenzyme A pyrophosphatase [Flavonifractor sp. An82]
MTLADFRARWAGHVPEIQDVKQEYAVLVPLVEGPEGLSLLFEVRASTLAHQPGEVCFPGGKVERGESPRDCALRETFEELAIPAGEVEIISPLDLLVQQGKFVMHPFLGVVSPAGLAAMAPSPAEVDSTFLVPVEWLRTHPPQIYSYELKPQVGTDFPYDCIGFPNGYRWRSGTATVPVYPWTDRPIWGLTGRIVRRLMEGMA